jgi:hypothetical protein
MVSEFLSASVALQELSSLKIKSLPEFAALEGFNARIIAFSGQLHSPLYNDNNAHQRSLGGGGHHRPATVCRTDWNIVCYSAHSQNQQKMNNS